MVYLVTSILKQTNNLTSHKTEKNDLTLKELYDLTNIVLTVKVYNTDLGKIEYINYMNHPNIKCTTLSMMTTASYLFQPIKYNDKSLC